MHMHKRLVASKTQLHNDSEGPMCCSQPLCVPPAAVLKGKSSQWRIHLYECTQGVQALAVAVCPVHIKAVRPLVRCEMNATDIYDQ